MKHEKGAVRLDKLLSNLGYGTRREMQTVIKMGAFEVNGEEMRDPSSKIGPSQLRDSEVLYDGEPLDPISPITLIMNKPEHYVSSHTDKDGPSVFDFLPYRFRMRSPKISIAGRLDMDSTGLLIFTDDGELLHRLTHPKSHARKIYQVEVRDPLSGKEEDLFGSGEVMLTGEEKPLKPVEFEKLSDKTCRLVLTEGRYHQIKRMFEHLGNEVVKLHREKVSFLTLGSLKPGEWRYLDEKEYEDLKNG